MITKCPDHQLLSVYFDGELPSPWKEKMESHISGCSRCTRRMEAYRRFSLSPDTKDTAAMGTAHERVWQNLEQRAIYAPRRRRAAVWRRSVSIPLPAAAAVFLLIALAFAAVGRFMGTTEDPGMTLASEAALDVPGIIPAADMEDVLQYLGSRDNGEIIILRLPESRNFVNYGEPAFIRAADYSRQVGNQAPGRQMPGRRKP